VKDTPDHIKKLQLQIWLAKSPAERLRQAIEDNEALFAFWEHARSELAIENGKNVLLHLL